MEVLTLLEEARRAGLTLSVKGDRLVVRGPSRAENLAKQVLGHKEEVPAVLRERRAERAAIIEFDAGLPRVEAERRAGLYEDDLPDPGGH